MEIIERPLKPALWSGWKCRCPECRQGRLLLGYLKVRDHCDHCGEELFHHRADDGPAYLTILVVGHLIVPIMHVVFVHFRPPAPVFAAVFVTAAVLLSLYLLPRLKGVVLCFQWAKRMHGFGQNPKPVLGKNSESN